MTLEKKADTGGPSAVEVLAGEDLNGWIALALWLGERRANGDVRANVALDIWPFVDRFMGGREMTAETISQILVMQAIWRAPQAFRHLGPIPPRWEKIFEDLKDLDDDACIEIPVRYLGKLLGALREDAPRKRGRRSLSWAAHHQYDCHIREARRRLKKFVCEGQQQAIARSRVIDQVRKSYPHMSVTTIERDLQVPDSGTRRRQRRRK